MAKKDENGNVMELIQNAVAEAREVKTRVQGGSGEDYALTSEMLAARYRQVMDAAEAAISSEYRQSGTLTGAKVCEINNGMDDYALTVQNVLDLLHTLEEDQ